MGKLYVAKGDAVRAETEYKAAARDAPPAVSALVAMYIERGERPKAEAFLFDVVKTPPVNMAALDVTDESLQGRARAFGSDSAGRGLRAIRCCPARCFSSRASNSNAATMRARSITS